MIPIGETVRIDFRAEMFNLFNHANYTSFNTTLSATAAATTASFGQPTGDDIPREGQLGFRISF